MCNASTATSVQLSEIMANTSVWALFLTTHAVLVDKIEEALKAAELPSLLWYDVLWALERAPEHRLRMHELADHVVLSRSNLTRLVDKLAAEGLVRRYQALDDRRGAYCVLLPAGQELHGRMWPVYLQCIERYFNQFLNRSEGAVLQKVLRRMLDAARNRAI